MKDAFDRLFHPREFTQVGKWAELSINQSAFKHVGHKEIELEEIDEAGNTAFHVAAAKDFLPIFDILPFIRGGGYNLKNKEGRSPLHIAAEKGHLMFCQIIFTESCDEVISADNNGMLPLHLAAKAGHLSICKVCIYSFFSLTYIIKHTIYCMLPLRAVGRSENLGVPLVIWWA